MKLVKLFLVLCFFGFISGLMAVSLATRKQSDDTGKPSDFKFTTFVQPSYEGRSQDIKTLFQNSSAGEFFIGLRYSFDASSMQTVNSDRVASGRNRDWLFLKDKYDQCYDVEFIDRSLNRIAALKAVAEGADIRVSLSVSPDKGLVYNELISPQLANIGQCKFMNAMFWRSRNHDSGAGILDFYPNLMVGRNYNDVYFEKDTHWNKFGQRISLESLIADIIGKRAASPSEIFRASSFIEEKGRNSDLARMLRWNDSDSEKLFQLPKLQTVQDDIRVFVIHDSFFNYAMPLINQSMPSARSIHFNSANKYVGKEINFISGDILILNTVERSLFERFPAHLSANHPVRNIFESVLSANDVRARECVFSSISEKEIQLRNASWQQGSIKLNRDPGLIVQLPTAAIDSEICIRVSYQREEVLAADTVYLPASDGTFRAGLEFDTVPTKKLKTQAFQLILPPEYAGREIRYDFNRGSDTISDLSVQTGVYRPETAQ